MINSIKYIASIILCLGIIFINPGASYAEESSGKNSLLEALSTTYETDKELIKSELKEFLTETQKKIEQRKAETTNKDIKACEVAKFVKKYTNSCLSCGAVSTLIDVFLRASVNAYDLIREAANEILMILSILWIAMFVLKQLSSFHAIELSNFMQELSIFLFKILVAWVFINGGISVILSFTLEPIISFGSDFGVAFLKLVSNEYTDSAIVTAVSDHMEANYV